jgi:hypothetical protein
MDSNLTKIAAVLSRAEKELLQLVSEAAAKADYQSIEAARLAAQGVRGMVESLEARHSFAKTAPRSRVGASHWAARTHRRRGRKAQPGYPRFSISSGRLFKTGWSKKRKREYVHKMPKTAFDLVVRAMASLAGSGRGPFTAEQIIDQSNKFGGAPVPDYQVYIVLAWLRAAELVQQVGREGYTFETALPEQAKARWETLAAQAA